MSTKTLCYVVVMGVYLFFLIWGVRKSLKQVESFSDFTTGGHRMGLIIGVGTSVATWVSVASIMGVPGYLYRTGAAAIVGWIAGWFFATALMPIFAVKVRMPKIPSRTFPEFIHHRFEPYQERSVLQIIVAVLMFIGYFIFTHLQVVGFGIIFNTITGIPYEYAIFGFLLVLLITCSGGFWSVAATDTVNAVLILFGLGFGCWAVLSATGGIGNIMEAVATTTAPINEGGKALEPGIMMTATGSFGAATLFSIFISNSLGAVVAPHWITRFMAPRNAKAAVLQMMWCLIFLIPIFGCLIVFGLGAKALMPSLPVGKTTDYIMPLIMDSYAPAFVAALTLVALLAAAVSTANSMLLHCSTSLYYDIYGALKGGVIKDEKKSTKTLRIWVFALGVIAVISAIKPPMMLAMGFTYVYAGFGAAFLVVVFLGLYWKRMNRAGAYAGIISGSLVFVIAKAMGATNPFIIGTGVSIVAVLIAVYMTPPPPLAAYEAYFGESVSPETESVIRKIRHEDATQHGEH